MRGIVSLPIQATRLVFFIRNVGWTIVSSGLGACDFLMTPPIPPLAASQISQAESAVVGEWTQLICDAASGEERRIAPSEEITGSRGDKSIRDGHSCVGHSPSFRQLRGVAAVEAASCSSFVNATTARLSCRPRGRTR